MATPPSSRRASRLRDLDFRRAYRLGTLDQGDEAPSKSDGAEAESGKPSAEKTAKRRQHLRAYFRWLWPYRYSVALVFAMALVTAGLQMVEPLFMRFIIDGVLLNTTLVIVSSLIGVFKDYRQRLLNSRIMLSLRRSLFDRLRRPAWSAAPTSS